VQAKPPPICVRALTLALVRRLPNAVHAHLHRLPIGNDVDGGVDGWLLGRPDSNGFWDEDSACVSPLTVNARACPTMSTARTVGTSQGWPGTHSVMLSMMAKATPDSCMAHNHHFNPWSHSTTRYATSQQPLIRESALNHCVPRHSALFFSSRHRYWIDGMTRLGLVLNDSTLIARVAADFDTTIRNPINFHNT
jgi:hypothetical protein